ncbi:MAG: non-canonical purine NTP pyrophosphatase, partial [Clostridia bacterium]|nr:non-canonical purine NTP pyrophosphatase [Clostridia bacterium]
MKILIGTTNPSKVKRFAEFLRGYDVEFCTLNELGITEEPDETGHTPEENAVIKAKFYGKYFDTVICNDSGLYFEELPLDDSRQPGLKIRTPGGRRLDDEEMITYYSALIHSLGDKVSAFYLDGIAVYRKGEIFSFMENNEDIKASAFYMVSQPS